MQDHESTILDAIRELLEHKGSTGLEVRPASSLTADLELESLDLAELSAALEDELGRDPFSEGLIPETVAELVAWYDS